MCGPVGLMETAASILMSSSRGVAWPYTDRPTGGTIAPEREEMNFHASS
jgi:hypothetical protein